MLAMGIYFAAFLLARQSPNRSLWIPFLVAIIVGAATLAYAVLDLEFYPEPTDLPPLTVIGIWLYRLAVLATLVGGIITVWKAASSLRSPTGSNQ